MNARQAQVDSDAPRGSPWRQEWSAAVLSRNGREVETYRRGVIRESDLQLAQTDARGGLAVKASRQS
jgi:hypothetical protein